VNDNLKRSIFVARGAQEYGMPGNGAIARKHARKFIYYVDRHRRLSGEAGGDAQKQDKR
jgi:hypothetical protein